jgi:CHAD domain-containing protein
MATGSPLRLAFDRRIRSLRRGLSGGIDRDVEGLHRARVATRRLREALPLLEAADALDHAERHALADIRKTIRRVTRALGGVRELDVALLLVAELADKRPDLDPALVLVRSAIERERGVRLSKMRDRVSVGDLQKAPRRLAELAARAEVDSPAELLSERVPGRARQLGKAIEQAGGLFAVDRLHRVRIAVKKLRYALELSHEIRGVPARPLIADLKNVQDLLGRLHDLGVVAGFARGLSTSGLADHVRPLVDSTLQQIEQELRERHADYLAARAALADIALQALTLSKQAARKRLKHGTSVPRHRRPTVMPLKRASR